MGRTATFAWQGYCDSAIDVVPTDDFADRQGFPIALRMLQELFLLSDDPERALITFADPGPGEVQHSDWNDGQEKFTRMAVSVAAGEIMLMFRELQNGSREWIYAIKFAREGRTILYHMRARPVPRSDRALPAKPEGILKIHEDVQGIRQIGIRDHTGFGRWDHDMVQYPNETGLGQLRDSISTGPWRWAADLALLLAGLAVAFFTHVRFERRIR